MVQPRPEKTELTSYNPKRNTLDHTGIISILMFYILLLLSPLVCVIRVYVYIRRYNMHIVLYYYIYFNNGFSHSFIYNLFVIYYSPRSGTSSNASTPSTKKMEDKPSTPISKSITPTSGGSGCSGAAGSSMKPMGVKGPSLGIKRNRKWLWLDRTSNRKSYFIQLIFLVILQPNTHIIWPGVQIRTIFKRPRLLQALTVPFTTICLHRLR